MLGIGGGGGGGRRGGLLVLCEFTFNSVPGWGKKIKEFSAVRVTVNQKRKYGTERRSKREPEERERALWWL